MIQILNLLILNVNLIILVLDIKY